MTRFLNFLPNINLVDEEGKEHTFHSLIKEKTVVLNMFYSRCQIKCQPLGRLLRRVNLLLKDHLERDNIVFISISLDGDNDGVKELNEFKQKVWDSRCKSWHFYTGKEKEIEVLRYKLGMYSPEPEVDKVKSNHSGNFLIMSESINSVKHTESFDNPVDVARKVVQLVPRNSCSHSYSLRDLDYDALTNEELFENIQTMNSMFTIPYLPPEVRDRYERHAELQRGFQYNPLKETVRSKKSCCCKKSSSN